MKKNIFPDRKMNCLIRDGRRERTVFLEEITIVRGSTLFRLSEDIEHNLTITKIADINPITTTTTGMHNKIIIS